MAPVRSCPSTGSFCLGRCSLVAECWSWEEDAVLPAWLSIPHSSGFTPVSASPGRLLGDGSPLPPWPKAWYAAGGISQLFVLRVKVLATGWDRPEYPTWAAGGGGCLAQLCWEPRVPGCVTAAACRGDLRGEKDGLGTLFTWRNRNIFFLLFASIPRVFGPYHERRSIFVSLLDFPAFLLKIWT